MFSSFIRNNNKLLLNFTLLQEFYLIIYFIDFETITFD